jgi:hypothetical protein
MVTLLTLEVPRKSPVAMPISSNSMSCMIAAPLQANWVTREPNKHYLPNTTVLMGFSSSSLVCD